SPVPNPPPPADENDDLPAVGRVWEGGGSTSVFAAFRKSKTATPSASAKPLAAKTSELADLEVSADATRPITPANIDVIDRQDFSRLLTQFHTAAAQSAPTVVGFLEGGKIVSLEAGTVTLEYPRHYEASARMLDRAGKRESLQQVLSEMLGEPIGLKLSISDREPELISSELPSSESRSSRPVAIAPREARAAAAPLESTPANTGIAITEELRVELLKSNPLIKSLAEEFGARIVKVE
ncbi:MAG: hypothetical protein H7144_14650, partial [Burkholderiales bacterium]|nr:hypothetical protein [Phycisphaerae bacterium]